MVAAATWMSDLKTGQSLLELQEACLAGSSSRSPCLSAPCTGTTVGAGVLFLRLLLALDLHPQ